MKRARDAVADKWQEASNKRKQDAMQRQQSPSQNHQLPPAEIFGWRLAAASSCNGCSTSGVA